MPSDNNITNIKPRNLYLDLHKGKKKAGFSYFKRLPYESALKIRTDERLRWETFPESLPDLPLA